MNIKKLHKKLIDKKLTISVAESCTGGLLANSSSLGEICLHGPHHSAQKSTRTNLSFSKTSEEKLSLLISLAIIFCDPLSEVC